MKSIYIIPALILTLVLTWTFKLKGETKTPKISEEKEKQEINHEHSHGEEEGDEHGHGKKEGDEHGHGKEEGDEHGHGKEEGDEHGHGKEEGDEHGHDKEEGDEHGHDKEEGDEHGHGHGGGEKVGPDKAITEVDEEKGFKLSKEALNTLDIKLQIVNAGQILISKSTLVTSKNNTGVYRYRDGYFKLIPATIKQRYEANYLIEARDLQAGDQIVTEGVGLIAITDVYSTDTAEYGHGH